LLVAARGAQQPTLPIVGFVKGRSPDVSARHAGAFRKGLNVESQNVTVEYHWLDGRYDRLPALTSELVRRQVAVIATPGSNPASLAAKAATTTIPTPPEDSFTQSTVRRRRRRCLKALGQSKSKLHSLFTVAPKILIQVNVALCTALLRWRRRPSGSIRRSVAKTEWAI
jgi:hypothetical protein